MPNRKAFCGGCEYCKKNSAGTWRGQQDFCRPFCRTFPLWVISVDAMTGARLGGRYFCLSDGNAVQCGVTNGNGAVMFYVLPCKCYRLTKLPPSQPGTGYPICFTPDGTMLFNGHRYCPCFVVPSYPAAATFFLSFSKITASQPFLIKRGTHNMAIPLQGATFELRDSGGNVLLTATSDASGIVALGNVSPGTYTLVETVTPFGFIPGGPYTVVVSPTGEITIDGIPLADFEAENLPFPNLTFTKTDSVGNPLQGAIFALDDISGTIQYAESSIDGSVTFYGIHPGQYLLSEDTPPFGFLPDPTVYLVEVAQNGAVTIGGNDPAGFTVINQAGGSLTFVKLDLTPDSAVPVLDPVRSGLIPVTGTGVPESTITVTWPDASVTEVLVTPDNTWTALPPAPLLAGETVSVSQTTPNHLPSGQVSEIVQPTSEPPVINEVLAGDADVTGTGIPGSTVTIIWPDGSSDSVTVEPDDTWVAAPPGTLLLGQEISAVQTTPGMLPSLPDTVTVQQISPAPAIDEVHAGDPVVSGTGIAGSTIGIDWPAGAPGTTTVGSYGTWIAFPPDPLVSGQELSVTQTAPGMLTSPPATAAVL